eukprot:CAMPEP_0170065922 /NCGR_PEP_ID=MMETSP0019_2-20121128/5813_1 /TAXON_ID=98059 /ORGANISM="Dinobryon sp., Strain UTEXLB2267" /LENGTH=97 /DNA_ID=CAMNT_0010272883 /DNA_START=367 /DNA_END=659 /DNA_ORIENTATION=-
MHTKLDNEIHGDKTGNPHASAGKHLLAGLPSKAVLSTVGEPAMILQIREEQSANAVRGDGSHRGGDIGEDEGVAACKCIATDAIHRCGDDDSGKGGA